VSIAPPEGALIMTTSRRPPRSRTRPRRPQWISRSMRSIRGYGS